MADETTAPGTPNPATGPHSVPPNGSPPPPTTSVTAGTPPTQIILRPNKTTQTTTPVKKQPTKPDEPKDNFREVVETVVFVVVLVLLLKMFLAEAFVIPTGSMAETLLGYHRPVTCEQCGYFFPVNASDEADPQDGQARPLISCTCPNCGARNRLGQRPQGVRPR